MLHRLRLHTLLSFLLVAACADARTRTPDAGAQSDAAIDAGVDPELVQATASATLLAVSTLDAGAGAALSSGSATFVATRSGVDLTLTIPACVVAPAHPVRILAAHSCDDVRAESATWAKRGEGIPALLCTSKDPNPGATHYSRANGAIQHWTIGDGASSDLVGHALAVFDGESGAPLLCGVIERGDDRVLSPFPDADAGSSVAARAQLAGACLAQSMTVRACTNSEALAGCASEHCGLGACAQRCADYTACLDRAPDMCDAAFTCEINAECARCQGEVTTCVYGFCGGYLSCPPAFEPDGACSKLAACCSLQGDQAAACLAIQRVSANIGGETTCNGELGDRAILSLLHVPCVTEAALKGAGEVPADESLPDDDAARAFCATDADCDASPAAGHGAERCVAAGTTALLSVPGRCMPRESTDQLDDHVVGTACEEDADCGGGDCAETTALGTGFPDRYCTARCYEDAECGAGGVCLLLAGVADRGHCLAACESDGDCTRDHYRCWALGTGDRLVHACYPGEPALSDHSVGVACKKDGDCAGDAGCVQETPLVFLVPDQLVPMPGGYCSAACSLDTDCGAGAQCISTGPDGGLCLASCSDDASCRDGYTCLAHLRDGDPQRKVCVPIWNAPKE